MFENFPRVVMDIGRLKALDVNPRSIDEKDLETLARSLQDFPTMMYIRPVAIRGGVVYAGNQRLLACERLGLDAVPTINIDSLTDAEAREFAIKDNAPASGRWDYGKLREDWGDLPLEDWGLDLPDEDFETPEAEGSPQEFKDMDFTFTVEQYREVKQLLRKARGDINFDLIETGGNEDLDAVALFALLTGVL